MRARSAARVPPITRRLRAAGSVAGSSFGVGGVVRPASWNCRFHPFSAIGVGEKFCPGHRRDRCTVGQHSRFTVEPAVDDYTGEHQDTTVVAAGMVTARFPEIVEELLGSRPVAVTGYTIRPTRAVGVSWPSTAWCLLPVHPWSSVATPPKNSMKSNAFRKALLWILPGRRWKSRSEHKTQYKQRDHEERRKADYQNLTYPRAFTAQRADARQHEPENAHCCRPPPEPAGDVGTSLKENDRDHRVQTCDTETGPEHRVHNSILAE